MWSSVYGLRVPGKYGLASMSWVGIFTWSCCMWTSCSQLWLEHMMSLCMLRGMGPYGCFGITWAGLSPRNRTKLRASRRSIPRCGAGCARGSPVHPGQSGRAQKRLVRNPSTNYCTAMAVIIYIYTCVLVCACVCACVRASVCFCALL